MDALRRYAALFDALEEQWSSMRRILPSILNNDYDAFQTLQSEDFKEESSFESGPRTVQPADRVLGGVAFECLGTEVVYHYQASYRAGLPSNEGFLLCAACLCASSRWYESLGFDHAKENLLLNCVRRPKMAATTRILDGMTYHHILTRATDLVGSSCVWYTCVRTILGLPLNWDSILAERGTLIGETEALRTKLDYLMSDVQRPDVFWSDHENYALMIPEASGRNAVLAGIEDLFRAARAVLDGPGKEAR